MKSSTLSCLLKATCAHGCVCVCKFIMYVICNLILVYCMCNGYTTQLDGEKKKKSYSQIVIHERRDRERVEIE